MEFGLLLTDIRVYVSCKIVMYRFKIALVINKNVRNAFLYVLTICCGCVLESPHRGDSNTYPQHMILWRTVENYSVLSFCSQPQIFPIFTIC